MAAGTAARETIKAIVREAVVEAIRELEDRGELRERGGARRSDSGGGKSGRSILLLGVGAAAGYLLAKRPPSWMRTVEESIVEDEAGPLESAADRGERGSEEGSGGGGESAPTSVDSETID